MQETQFGFLGREDLLEKGWLPTPVFSGFPGGSDGKVSACNGRDPGSISRLGRSPEERNGNPLQYSCLENRMDGVAWSVTVQVVAKSQTWLSNFTFTWIISFCKCQMTFLCAQLLKSCPVLCDIMDCSLPGSSVHGVLQLRKLGWVAIPGDLSHPGTELSSPTSLTLQTGYLLLSHWVSPPDNVRKLYFKLLFNQALFGPKIVLHR